MFSPNNLIINLANHAVWIIVAIRYFLKYCSAFDIYVFGPEKRILNPVGKYIKHQFNAPCCQNKKNNTIILRESVSFSAFKLNQAANNFLARIFFTSFKNHVFSKMR